MALYEYKCSRGHKITLAFAMGTAPAQTPCICNTPLRRVIGDFQFQQDNRRLRKGVSPVTGLPYAESRREERMIEKALGIEFTGPADMPKQWKEASAYKTHVDQGGEQLPMGQVITPEAIESRPLTSYMDEAGYKKSEATHDPTPEHQQQQLQKIVEASA